MTIAFDTNILIYACDATDNRRQAQALQLIESAEDAIMMWQAAVEFIAASRKLDGMNAQQAWQRLDQFLAAFPLVMPTIGVLKAARTLHIEQQCSFFDSLMIAACIEAGVTRLYSEDLPGRAPSVTLEIVNPFV